MTKVKIALQFDEPGFIGLPYWPERNTLIDVLKDVHPKLGDAKKAAALLAALEKRGLTMEDHARLELRAARPFYTENDSDAGDGEIVIPQRTIQSFLNNASQSAPKAVPRIENKGLTFIGVKVGDGNGGKFLRTAKTKKDAVKFGRFVMPEDGNQRRWTEQDAIADFQAAGVLDIDEEIIQPDQLKTLITWGGKFIGLGSARPQGYGRFGIACWEIL
jgi:hypothetical protein